MRKQIFITLFLIISLLAAIGAQAADLDWPRDLDIESGTLTTYQPQVDKLEGDVLYFRTAVAYKDDAGSEPVFGAAWFESRVVIDRDQRMVQMVDLKVTDMRFPEGSEHVQSELHKFIAEGLPGWSVDFSLDALLTSLEASEEEISAASNLKMDPPAIIYRDHPALLVSIDGDPVLRDIENSNYKAVINTPYPLIYDGRKNYYLNAAADVWYRAEEVTGPWAFDGDPPQDIAGMVEQEQEEETGGEKITRENAPEIVVSLEPAELLVTEGEPDFESLVEDLLVLKNSQSDVFMHVSAQNYYIVLSGRWFRSKSLNGPWEFNAADELPPAFNNIPTDSKQAESRVYIAGTDEAREAVMDAQIPQTAAVQKGQVDIEVTYDGQPQFQGIEGTSLSRAINTGSTVLLSGQNYYLVEDAVWYISTSAAGPWRVAEARPEDVESIPPEDPAYNVKYVYVYDSTPEVVYVGYTPGYTGSYVYNTTIVYGTGWYYRPWISPYYYYPYHATWGFHITYNPWTGWGFGLSWGWGPFRVGFYPGGYWHRRHHWHHHHHGRWGPGGYRPVHHGNRNVNINTGDININAGNRIGAGNMDIRNDNLYRDKAQKANVSQTRDFRPATQEARDRVAGSDRPAARPDTGNVQRPAAGKPSARPSTSENNVFTDRSGNVYRQTDGGWQKNDGKGWSNVASTGSDRTRPSTGTSTRPSTGAGTSQGSRDYNRDSYSNTRNSSAYQQPSSGYNRNSSLDRQSYSRNRASTRNQQFHSQRSAGGKRRR
jgi:hypothetical protein